MGSGYYAQLCAILRNHGCTLTRQAKGSHEIWYSPITKIPVTISVTVSSRHTANGILKQAGIDQKI
ncbi:MAG: type II toxin-antitoxin system HicA family toxin [Azoarcus sp.]|jgi:predicted RNA binding protein YcfA (HicA-like mRNA interferase family)|nr:type II toxin-antitoxin system HicA family toxin [Azoarcus sp.]